MRGDCRCEACVGEDCMREDCRDEACMGEDCMGEDCWGGRRLLSVGERRARFVVLRTTCHVGSSSELLLAIDSARVRRNTRAGSSRGGVGGAGGSG